MTLSLDLPAASLAESRSVRLTYVPVLPLWALQTAAFVIFAFKLAFSAVVPPGSDDGYYWLWGQHLQWSYLDHAPMVGWGAWVSFHLLGWTPLALHLMPLVSFGLSALVMRSWAKRIAGEHWRHYFWATLAVYLASPLMMAIGSILYPDQILMAMSLGSLHFLALFLADWWLGRRNWLNLYLGAAMLGLAMLSKYNGALIAVGFFLAIVADPRLRSLLRTPHLWLAGLVAALFLLPILGWNMTHDFASLKLHSSDRFARRGEGFALDGTLGFLRQLALYLSPFLVWPLFRSLTTRGVVGPEGAMIAVGRWIFLISTIALAALASWVPAAPQVAAHWDIVGLMPFVLLAPLFIRSAWLMALHLIFGTLVAAVVCSYFALAPLVTHALNMGDGEASIDYGQEQLAAAVGRAKWANDADFVATHVYNVAAKFAWGAKTDAGLVSLSPTIDQFYFWHDVRQYTGKSGIVIEENTIDPKSLSPFFADASYLGPVTVTRFGLPLKTYYLYLGKGYHGVAPKP